jgi:membrane protein DedA with SNARE-associated domain
MDRRWASVAIWCGIWLVTGLLAGHVLRDRPTETLAAVAVIILGGAVLLWRQWQ